MTCAPTVWHFGLRHLLLTASLFATAMVAAVKPVAAQSIATASIEGVETDPSGGALPGVLVTLTSPALQVAQITDMTNPEGHYRFTQLPVGVYQVRYELSGFQTTVRDSLQIGSGFAARVDVVLKVGDVAETINVTAASPIVDVTTTATGTTLSTNQVNNLLPSSRMYGDMSRMVSAMRTTSAPTIGRIGFGSTGGYIAYGNASTILRFDGLEVLGNTYPDFSTAQETEIKSAGLSADVSTAGSVWNIVTKSGGNQFHGRLSENYINGGHGLQANNVDALLMSQGLSNADSVVWFTDFTGDFGGRIVPDKLWFYTAYRRRQNKRTAAGEVLSANPVCGCVTDNTPYVAPDKQDNYTEKLSYQPSSKYQLVGLFAHDISVNNGGVETSKGARRFIPYESDTYEVFDPAHLIGEFRAVFRDNLMLNVVGGRSHYTFAADDTPGNATKTAWFDRNTQYFGGGSIGPASNYAQYFDPHLLNSLRTFLTFLPHNPIAGGTHQFAIGGGMGVAGGGGTVPNHPAGNYQITYDVVGGVPHQPVEIAVFNFPLYQPNRSRNENAFVSDRWEIGKRMTVNIGLRFDQDHAYIPPLTKVQGQFGGSGSFPQVEGNTFRTVSPRTAIAYDVTGNGKTVIKATWSQYGGAAPSAAPYSLAGVTTTTYRFHDLNHDGMYEPGEVNLDLNGPDFLSITGNGVATNIFNPNLTRSHTDEVTAVLDRELMANMAAHVVYVYRRDVGLPTTVNPLRPYSAFNIPLTRRDPGPDGIVGTSDDGGLVTIYDYGPAYRGAAFSGSQVENRPDDRSDHYNTMEFTLVKRTSSKWGVQTSFLTSKNYVFAVGIPQSPNDNYFPVDESWNWVYKINGSYQLPYNMVFSGLFDVQPGIRGQRTYVFRAADPNGGPSLQSQSTVTLRLSNVGDYVGPTRASANLRLAKLARLRGREARFSVDLLNAFNSNAFWAMGFISGPTFGYGTAFTSPRVLQFGASFDF